MGLEIFDECETLMGCVKAVTVSVYSAGVIILVVIIMYKLYYQKMKRASFELIPLTSTILQSLMQFALNFFVMDTKLIVTSLAFQALTFGIVSTSCSQLSLRIKYPEHVKAIKKWTLTAFAVAMTILLVMLMLTLFDVIPIYCEDWFSLAYLFPMGVMTIYTAISVVYGSSLINFINENEINEAAASAAAAAMATSAGGIERQSSKKKRSAFMTLAESSQVRQMK